MTVNDSSRLELDLGQPTPEQLEQQLWAMTAAQRRAACLANQLELSQLLSWARQAPGELPRLFELLRHAARFPERVPTLHGEYWFIAVHSPDFDED